MNHKDWLDNEYNLWVKALEESTVDNFKDHPQVKRMLSEADHKEFLTEEVIDVIHTHPLLRAIDNIGETHQRHKSGRMVRTIYWALEVLKLNPQSIAEIGAGIGEFYAVIKELGFTSDYYIYDLVKVKEFQRKYLDKVQEVTGLELPLLMTAGRNSFCVSFYALGEFDDELKRWYIDNVVNLCPHGFLVWDSHSGASKEININHKISVQDSDKEDTKIITW